MKKLTLVALVLILNGCALIDAYRMARFDNNEYMLVNRIQTQAHLGATKCGTPVAANIADEVWFKTVELKLYSAGIPHNQETVKMTAELNEIAKGLSDRYHSEDEVSPAYCKIKFGNIEKNAVTIQTVIGAKPR